MIKSGSSIRTPNFNGNTNWTFDNCKMTDTSSLPITPSACWEPLQFQHNSKQSNFHSMPSYPQPVHHYVPQDHADEVIHRLLNNWDPILDKYLSMFIE